LVAVVVTLASVAALAWFVVPRVLLTLNGGIGGHPLSGLLSQDCTRDPADLPPPPPNLHGRPGNYLHTCGALIYDVHGNEVRMTGVNWSGMENSGDAPGGLGSRNWQELLDQVASLGYNAIRIPITNEAIESGQPVGNVDFALNPDLSGLTGLEVLDRLVEGARRRGLKVVLDRHQPTSSGRTALWYTSEVPEGRWIADWRMLAARYRGNDAVVAVDLANEPHGNATWGTGDVSTDWRLAAERAGNAVLEVNPYLLVFVEGVEDVGSDHFWWGGNLAGVRSAPVTLRVPNRVVYSPHDYGPAISAQGWFSDPRFPANLAGEWDQHWGYIARSNIAPVVLGEFGGWSFGNDADGQWQTSLLQYIAANHLGAFVWSLNPSWDTGGILNDDWKTVDAVKQQAYRPILAPPIDRGPTGVFGRAPSEPHVVARRTMDGSGQNVNVTFGVFNDGPTPLDLGQVEVRYWYDNRALIVGPTPIDFTTDGISPGNVSAQAQNGLARPYVEIRFSGLLPTVGPYRGAGSVTLHLRRQAGLPTPSAVANALVGPLPPNIIAPSSDTVGVYLAGKLVEGKDERS
jgi:endoglucanase